MSIPITCLFTNDRKVHHLRAYDSCSDHHAPQLCTQPEKNKNCMSQSHTEEENLGCTPHFDPKASCFSNSDVSFPPTRLGTSTFPSVRQVASGHHPSRVPPDPLEPSECPHGPSHFRTSPWAQVVKMALIHILHATRQYPRREKYKVYLVRPPEDVNSDWTSETWALQNNEHVINSHKVTQRIIRNSIPHPDDNFSTALREYKYNNNTE